MKQKPKNNAPRRSDPRSHNLIQLGGGSASRAAAADEFRLSHTLEHIPSEQYVEFLLALRWKLRVGGILTIIQTDVGPVLAQYQRGELSFRAMWRVPFLPTAPQMREDT